MPAYFFDTSALVKRYAPEAGTETVDQLVESGDSHVVITSLAVVEATSAARRKFNQGTFSERDVEDLLATFYSEALSTFEIVPMDEAAMALSFDLILEHDLRTLDSVQLSSALILEDSYDDLVFVCSDRELLDVADGCGLPTLDPVAGIE